MQISAAKARYLNWKRTSEIIIYSEKDLIFISDPLSLVTQQYTCLSYLFELTLETTDFPNTTIFSSQFLYFGVLVLVENNGYVAQLSFYKQSLIKR